ncbi:hypothetical protein GCM10023075_66870 [Streptosporangium album]|uniref:hypothetical protein n=1 Tax=Streptosporangium album TaxID=47479 RepID=UPI0031EE63D1
MLPWRHPEHALSGVPADVGSFRDKAAPRWRSPRRSSTRFAPGRYVCGDHRDTGSQQGAPVSGRRTAEAVLADRG